jgi:hypothetical protein
MTSPLADRLPHVLDAIRAAEEQLAAAVHDVARLGPDVPIPDALRGVMGRHAARLLDLEEERDRLLDNGS